MNTKAYSDNGLQLQVQHQGHAITIVWMGRSTAREPGAFIGPVLSEAFAKGADGETQLVLDFRALEYMNSSTITPIIRILHEAKRSKNRVLVLYNKAAKWQDLSFSALTIFATDDERIAICGA